jgi:DTW domain-containing protein YfiP
VWASGIQLRQLFTTIMCHCEVTDVIILWDSTWQVLPEDMQYRRRRILNLPTLQLTDEQKKAYALLKIEKNNAANW